MSFFETASLVLISDFAAASASVVSGSGTNTGKAYSVKPTDGSGDFDFERGSDITATRVNKDGYIEKGRGNFLLNSVWDGVSTDTRPTGWSAQSVTGTGTFDVTSTEGQIRFTTSDVSSRSFIYTPSILINGILTVSVYVDQVYTTCPINQVIVRSGNATTISYFEDGVEISSTTNVQAGKRYSVVFDKTGTTTFRFGVGASSNTLGDIVLSRPQIEQGLVATDYIETTTAPLRAGLLEDEPRFDYHNSASASPSPSASLLLEPSRTNLITNSEYLTGGITITSQINNGLSPEGKTNATLIQGDGTGIQPRYPENVTTTAGEHILSVFAKSGNNDFIALGFQSYTSGSGTAFSFFDLANGTTPTAGAKIENYGNGWYRCISPPYTVDAGDTSGINTVFLTPSTSSLNFSSLAEADGKNVFIYGFQLEQDSYATSYIPTYGTAATRGGDNCFLNSTSILEQTSATYFLEATPEEITSNNFIDARGASSTDNRILCQCAGAGTPGDLRILVRAQGSSILDQDISSAVAKGTKVKVALKYTPTNITVYVDGVKKIDTDVSVDFSPEINGIDLEGSATANYEPLRHHQFLFFPEALSDADLATLTTL